MLTNSFRGSEKGTKDGGEWWIDSSGKRAENKQFRETLEKVISTFNADLWEAKFCSKDNVGWMEV